MCKGNKHNLYNQMSTKRRKFAYMTILSDQSKHKQEILYDLNDVECKLRHDYCIQRWVGNLSL